MFVLEMIFPKMSVLSLYTVCIFFPSAIFSFLYVVSALAFCSPCLNFHHVLCSVLAASPANFFLSLDYATVSTVVDPEKALCKYL